LKLKEHAVSDQPVWQWNEFVQVGVDYANVDEVRVYEERMSTFRDFSKENAEIAKTIGLKAGQTIIEIGVGTGVFARYAAASGAKVIACDVSPMMLQYAAEKSEAAGLSGIQFHHAGFLTYRHAGPAADAVVSQLALHHLPDFWKAVALRRVAAMLRPGGRLYLRDVAFPASAAEGGNYFDAMIADSPAAIRDEVAVHIRQEYSTFDWLLEDLLDRAGFSIDLRTWHPASMLVLACTKK
jgi:ubiquinone/menaquinone biosynthesis C-methylase UbiE